MTNLEFVISLDIIGNKGVKGSETSTLICEFEDKNPTNCKLAQPWYRRFESGDMRILDKQGSGTHRSLSLELIKFVVRGNYQLNLIFLLQVCFVVLKWLECIMRIVLKYLMI